MFKKLFLFFIISFQAFSYGEADPISVDVNNISNNRLPGITFSVDRKIDFQKERKKTTRLKSSGFGIVSGEVRDNWCEDCSLNQFGYDFYIGKNISTTLHQANSLMSFVTENEKTPFLIKDHGAGLSLSLLEGFYYGGLSIGGKYFRAVMMVGAGGRIEIVSRNGILEVGGGVKVRLVSDNLGLRIEAINRGTWSAFTMSSESESGISISSNPTLTILQKGRVLDKIKIALERRVEFVNTSDSSIRSGYSGLSLGFKW